MKCHLPVSEQNFPLVFVGSDVEQTHTEFQCRKEGREEKKTEKEERKKQTRNTIN